MYPSGKQLVAELSKQLGPHMQWTESEQLTLAAIERAADRCIPLAARFDALAANPDTPPAQLAAISGELRLIDNMVIKWAASLDPAGNAAKSQRHVAAANARWHRSNG